MSTSSAPLRGSDSDSDDAAEREVTSRSVPVEETVIATVIDGTDETRNADDAEDRVSETDDLPVEMDVDASMEDAFQTEDGDGGDVQTDAPADVSSAETFFARTETQADAPEHRRDGEQRQNERNDDVPRPEALFGPDEDDEKNASLAESRGNSHATPASVSRRIVTTSWYTQSSNASRSVSFGNRSTLVNTSRMGLPPTTSRTRFKNDPWKSVASTTFSPWTSAS